MNLDIDYFKRKLKEITDWYENTAWNKKTLLEKILELDTEINKTRDKENLIGLGKINSYRRKNCKWYGSS